MQRLFKKFKINKFIVKKHTIKGFCTVNPNPNNESKDIKSKNNKESIKKTFDNFATKTNGILTELKTQIISTKDFADLYAEMEKRNYNMRRIKIIMVIVAGFIIVTSYEFIIDFFSKQATTVTTRSLDNLDFIKELNDFGKNAGKQIISDLAKDPEIQKLLADMFKEIFSSELIKKTGSELASNIATDILTNEKYKDLHEKALDYGKSYAVKIMENEKIKDETSKFIWHSFKHSFLPKFIVGTNQKPIHESNIQIKQI